MARRPMTVTGTIEVDRTPADVYDQVSDPARMGRWSPENLGATVREEGRAAHVGMVFEGHNKRGPIRWTTRCTVLAADPGERFAFRVHAIGRRRRLVPAAIATWEYRFEPAGAGTRVTETWTDDRRSWPDALAAAFDKVVTRGHTFAAFQRRNIDTTLRNLKRVLESRDPV